MLLFAIVKFCRGGSRTAAISKMELFVIIVNGLNLVTKEEYCPFLLGF